MTTLEMVPISPGKGEKMTTYEMVQGSEMKHAGRFVVGMVVGALAGAVTSLLLAPQSGQATRHLIQTKTIELRDRTVSTAGSVSEKVRTKADQIKAGVSGKAMDLTHQGKEMLARQLDRVSIAAENGKKALQ